MTILTDDERAALAENGIPTGDEIDAWVTARYGNRHPLSAAAKLSEEAGEALGATLKRAEGRTDDDWTARLREEVGDVGICLLALSAREGWDLGPVIAERWAQVVTRGGPGAPYVAPDTAQA